jgi:glycerophosphoryl diester phosphodiesterase
MLTDSAPANLRIAVAADRIGTGLEKQLEDELHEHPKTKLIVIDTLQRVRGTSGSKMSYEADYADMTALKRIADEDIAVEGVSLDTLQSVLLFDKLGGKLRRDLRISSLEEYLFICKKYEKHSVLELKSDFSDEEIEKIIETVKSFDYLDHLTFISFKYSNLEKVRQILPTQSAQFLFSTWSEETFEKLLKAKIDIDSNHNAITEEIIKRAHEAGLTVNVWTVDSPERAELLASYGIDFITTNILE